VFCSEGKVAGKGCKSIACASAFNLLIDLALQLTFGGMCMLPQHRGGACFCTRGAMKDCDGYYFIIALAKTVTPAGGPRREPGRAVAPAAKPPL